MKHVYCVMMERLLGPGNGRIGYHSVFASQEDAERQCELRNKHSNCGMRYFVEVKVPAHLGKDFYNKNHVKFDDSVGMLVVL